MNDKPTGSPESPKNYGTPANPEVWRKSKHELLDYLDEMLDEIDEKLDESIKLLEAEIETVKHLGKL